MATPRHIGESAPPPLEEEQLGAQVAPEDLAPIVAIGGLGTIKQVAAWYRPVLTKDVVSELPPHKRFVAPYKRGLGGDIEDMRDDLTERLEKIQDRLDGRKLFLVGHSLGGLMATMTAVERPDLTAGAVSLGGVHTGYSQETEQTLALRYMVGNPPEGELLRHDSDFMLAHKARMEAEWPEDVPLHIVSTPFDRLVVPPQGYDVKLAHGEPHKQLVVPPVPGLSFAIRRLMGIPKDVETMYSLYPTEHINLPRNPDITNYIDESRRAIATAGRQAVVASGAFEYAAAA